MAISAQNFSHTTHTIPADMLNIPQEPIHPDSEQLSLRVRFNALMLGYLALNHMSDDPRWITVVSSKAIDTQSYKSLFGNKIRLRIIQAKSEDLLWITWQCLAQGNSHAVISTLDHLSKEELEQIGIASKIGNCKFHQV